MIVLFIDCVGALMMSVVLIAAWNCLVAPIQRRSIELPQLRQDLAEASRTCAELIRANQELSTRVSRAQKLLADESGLGVLGESQLAARVAEACNSHGVALVSIEPGIDTSEGGGRTLSIRGRGLYPQLHGVLARLESDSPYIRVLQVSVDGPQTSLERECRLQWVMRCANAPSGERNP
jgi:hypothetical protein